MSTRKRFKGLNVEIKIQLNGSSKITLARVIKWLVPLAILAIKVFVHMKVLIT